MKNKFLTISIGFALFSMFFGSGNLTFPLLAGYESGGHYGFAALGILLSGVVIPFIGVFALILFNGDGRAFFGLLGPKAYFWASVVCISLMGPFGVLARCITVAHGSLCHLFPTLSLPLFSALFCALVFACTLRKSRIIPLLGSLLTPFLLLSIGVIVLFALKGESPPTTAEGSPLPAFVSGLVTGYQTMDLVAALFFSSFVIGLLKRGEGRAHLFGKSALIGAGLLAAVYVALVAIGSLYAPDLVGVAPQELLATVANQALGPVGGPIVAAAIVLACLTTAIVLAELFAQMLRVDLTKGRLPPKVAMGITLLIGLLISTLEFSGIARFLGPILEVAYPALILFTLSAIVYRLWGVRPRRWPIFLAVGAALVWYIS
ncbi:MAG: branched-chain amino acid transport system II carrier protein [Parachlamydiales bacterium]